MFRNRPVSLVLVGLFVWVTACTSYKQIEPAEVADYGKVRVTFSDGEQLVLSDVTVEGDSIYYWQKVERPANYPAVRVSSPLDRVVVAEAAGAGTGGIVVAVVAGVVALALVICAFACDFDYFGE
ncbi:MAG: hypothetical protein WBO43_12410 [Gemmatimonadota bacterium]